MKTTTWTCDRCSKAQDTPEQMWEVGLAVKSLDNRHYTPTVDIMQKQEWCRACLDRYSVLIRWAAPEPLTETSAPTLEDFIREMVREVVKED